ncbi:ketopantoate reductase family protein [Roseococcus pinisoli]|uniref:2-dehydropantoate 2-reductase n=1 Tax=Roseococcus pinisoli TaxID=2835040 RepID=A0ABS5QDU7_9PROT|nr:ketopantoate reductase family protein [Roseococcus pinisoli]MBS7811872.1 ketopantoate reductase family protein [Roseococcus pinisoli]
MRILILGAGAIGGYYGLQLAKAGADVTFLVRPKRAEILAREGLVVHSRGEVLQHEARTVLAGELREPYDLVFLTCKAFDLDSAIEAIAPAIGESTALLPILNGMAHFDVLDARFGAERVLGGVCYIATMLAADGGIRHTSPSDTILFGRRDGAPSPQSTQLAEAFARTKVNATATPEIVPALWEKWAMIAAGAGLTSLMRGTVGEIMTTSTGPATTEGIMAETLAIVSALGHPPRQPARDQMRKQLTDPASRWAASMMRDIEQNAPRLEVDHIIGDLLRRGAEAGVQAPILAAANAHLQLYNARRAG